MKRNLLFVTYRDGDFGHDLSYALDLAKSTDKGMAILLVQRKKLVDKFETLMSAVTFAEAGEHETATAILNSVEAEDDLPRRLEEKCLESGMATAVYSAFLDSVSSLKEFLKGNNSIDMVLLSPSIMENGDISSRELKRLVKTASRPIVTMVKQAQVA